MGARVFLVLIVSLFFAAFVMFELVWFESTVFSFLDNRRFTSARDASSDKSDIHDGEVLDGDDLAVDLKYATELFQKQHVKRDEQRDQLS